MNWLPEVVAVGQVALASVVGGVLGAEREFARKPAGLRTHMLVSAAACLLMLLGLHLLDLMEAGGNGSAIQADPVRIIEATIVGISFLGAGTIIRQGADRVEGLTTAGSILVAAALGIAVALRLYLLAVLAALLVLTIIFGLGQFERKIRRTSASESRTRTEENRDQD